MNLHLMLILLSFAAPAHKDMELVDAPQIVAPLSLTEYEVTLEEWQYIVDERR